MENLRTHSQVLPKGKDNVIALLKRVLGLSGVQEIRVRPNEFYIERLMDSDDAPVLPKENAATTEVEVDFLLGKIADLDGLAAAVFSPQDNPYFCLESATRELTDRGLIVCGMLAPPDIISDYFNLSENIVDPPSILGIKMVYYASEKYAEKLVVLGGPTIYVADATYGIIIDMGV